MAQLYPFSKRSPAVPGQGPEKLGIVVTNVFIFFPASGKLARVASPLLLRIAGM